MVGLTSAAGVVGFLSEPDPALRSFALHQLNDQIDLLWPEVAGSVSQIEALYEDESFPERELAALVAAKVYYQLQEYNESMVFALGAGKLLDIHKAGEFEETILAKCVDTYIAMSAMHNPPTPVSKASQATPQLSISFTGGSTGAASTSASLTSPITPFSQSALPSKSLLSREDSNTFDPTIPGGGNAGVVGAHPTPMMLQRNVQKNLQATIRRIFESCYESGDYKQVVGIAIEARNLDVLRASIVRASQDEKKKAGKKPATGASTKSEELMDYVLDICMNVVQERGLRNEILRLILDLLNDNEIPNPDYFSIAKCVTYLDQHSLASKLVRQLVEQGDDKSLATAYQISFDLYENGTQEFLAKVMADLPESEGDDDESKPSANGDASEAKESDSLLADADTSNVSDLPPRTNKSSSDDHNKAFSSSVLNKIRDSLEARSSIFHSSVTFANAFMNAGTTNDTFFRENLDWLGKAGQKLLDPYLPKDSVSTGSHYEQGGSLYALGLIYANHGSNVLDYLVKQFQNASEEVIQHGGALGVGVAGMATGSEEIFDAFKSVLYTDSAINGEAVGLSMGLVMLGTGSIKALEDMIQYAHDTQHEKIEAADELINGLLEDPDPTLRYGGIMTIALAYCGTGSNKAVRRLLHVAVSDVSDDPGSVPRMVELLSESYNPHVRYGATMALGIACAGTGLPEAVDLLEPMMKDSTDFVRQGALIALAMIMVQQNEATNPKVASIRKQLTKIIGDRHEDAMAKMGCALALGIIDAGGRNCTIGLQTPTGNLNMAAIVGMAVFTQYWYWFPLTHFLSLSFTPTAIIGVDQDLQIPSFKFHSNTRPSMFDYPPETEVKAEEAPEKIKTAVLSTTAQDKRRRMVKERQRRRESMDVDQTPTTPKPADDDKMDVDDEKKDDEKKEDEKAEGASTESPKKKAEKEKVGYELENMSRVLPAQVKHITFPGDRFIPVKKPTLGVILLTDTKPSEPKTLLELKVKKAAPAPAPGASGSSGEQAAEGAAEAESSGPTTDNLVDEGDEEASLPGDFEYESDTNPNDSE
ncbi:enzyme regulator [Ascochyta rabiei]|uniref:26S proteasome regulatory subunit RPN2 n=1 Tax=Didymella rabiei TaxID=5454 RepID=A0A162Y1J8_DIDRA|nr:enzyme regulator [Ascochyta rabiei]